MTINFTGQMGGDEIWRVHGRYYSFVIPIYLFLMFAVAEQCRPRANLPGLLVRIPAIFGLATMPLAQFYWRTTYAINPFDFPELFALTSWPWQPEAWLLGSIMIACGALVFFAMIILPRFGPILFACFFCLFNLTSLRQTTVWQFAHMHGASPLTEAGFALRTLLPAEALDRGLIIAPNRIQIPYFLVALRSRSKVALVEAGSIVDDKLVGSADWVVLEGPYDVRLDGSRLIFHKGPLTALVPQSAPHL